MGFSGGCVRHGDPCCQQGPCAHRFVHVAVSRMIVKCASGEGKAA